MHKWRLNDYSFIWMLIRLASLIFVWKFFCIFRMLTRLVRLISTKIKEYFCIRSISVTEPLICGFTTFEEFYTSLPKHGVFSVSRITRYLAMDNGRWNDCFHCIKNIFQLFPHSEQPFVTWVHSISLISYLHVYNI